MNEIDRNDDKSYLEQKSKQELLQDKKYQMPIMSNRIPSLISPCGELANHSIPLIGTNKPNYFNYNETTNQSENNQQKDIYNNNNDHNDDHDDISDKISQKNGKSLNQQQNHKSQNISTVAKQILESKKNKDNIKNTKEQSDDDSLKINGKHKDNKGENNNDDGDDQEYEDDDEEEGQNDNNNEQEDENDDDDNQNQEEEELSYDQQIENNKKNSKVEEEDIEKEVKKYYKNLTKKDKIKMQIYLTLNDAEYSKIAQIYLICMLLICIVDVGLMILSTEQSLPIGKDCYWEYFNQYTAIIFFLNKMLQLYCCDAFIKGPQAYKNHFLTFSMMVDWLALIYSSFEALSFYLDYEFSDQVKILRALFTLRLIRVFKFSSINRGINILIAGVKQSVQALTILLFITIICIILISSFMYFAEKGNTTTKIGNIPEAIWWAVITITTVGYGDVIPQTLFGKIIASVSLIFGVLLLSLPVAIIGNNFQEIYLQNQKNDKNQSKKAMKRQFEQSKNEEEKEILRIWLKINELEEVNETIERCLQENQFLYRSIAREAQSLINRIDFSDQKNNFTKFGDSYLEGYDVQDPIVKKIKEQFMAEHKANSSVSYPKKQV